MSEPLYILAEQVGKILVSHDQKLVTAESCTGGWIAQSITDISGSSGWFDRGFVTYSNEAKQEMLGVNQKTIVIFGAVSEECVTEMVQGALMKSKADSALAVTGIAGPDGGSFDKPVGTVWFSWLVTGGQCRTLRQRFSGNREAVRRQAVDQALRGVLDLYKDQKGNIDKS